MTNLAPVHYNVTTSALAYNDGGGDVIIPTTGQGVPVGGTAGQVLAKVSATNYDTQWLTPASGGSASYPDIASADAYGAKDDCKFIFDAAMTSGSTTLTSAANPFLSTDVGKRIVVAGAANTTISAFNGAGSVTLAAAASATVSAAVCHWGTDSTSAINSAIASLTNGGTVMLGAGYYLVSSVNLTNNNSVILQGAAMGINANDKGTVFVPLTAGNMVDLTGSGHCPIRDIQIGTSRSAQIANVGILAAQSSAGEFSSLLEFNNVMINGSYNIAGLYVFGVGDSEARGLYVWNHIDAGKSAIIFTRDNVAGVTSQYATIATGEHICGNWKLDKFEAHETKASGQSTGNAMRLRGTGQMLFKAGYIDSSSSTGEVLYENTAAGTPNGNHRYEGVTMASEQTANCNYNINMVGSCDGLSFDENCSFTSAVTTFNGTGAINIKQAKTAALTANVAMNNPAVFFDGAQIAQGGGHAWFATGTVTIRCNNAAVVAIKLWDGTNVIASTEQGIDASKYVSVTLSGVVLAAAGNIRMSVQCSDTSGVLHYNVSGAGKDCTVTAIRI